MNHNNGHLGKFWPSVLRRAISADSRFNSEFSLQVQQKIVEQFFAGKFENSKETYRFLSFFSNFLPADFFILFGDGINEEILYTCRQHPRPVLILTSNVYSGNTAQQLESLVYTIGPEYYSAYFDHYDQEFVQTVPIKDCVCLISRMDPIRQSWLYQLIRRKIFDHSFVSFRMDTSRLSEFVNMPPDQVFEEQYKKYLLEFSAEHNSIRHLVPYRNFDSEIDLDDLHMQAKFNIVLETYFANNDELVFTEKTIRSLRLPRPWLLFSARYAVRQLRTWGFDVLDDLVDHGYDNIENNIVRQGVILDQAQKMCNFDVVSNWERLHRASIHNMLLLKSWKDNLESSGLRDGAVALDKIYELCIKK